MTSAIAQLSCFYSTISNRRLHLQAGSYSLPLNFRTRMVLNVMSSDGSVADVSNSENNKTTLGYVEDDASNSHNGSSVNSHPLTEPKRAAKIHDFCFGLPFGGLVLSGGLVGFLFTRNIVTLKNGVLYGGALLALSFISLKVWRKGKSSLPFILGQAVLSVALLRKNFHTYSLTQNLFPTGFNALICAAMLLFYSYVVISGGNPPPKKLKSSASVATS